MLSLNILVVLVTAFFLPSIEAVNPNFHTHNSPRSKEYYVETLPGIHTVPLNKRPTMYSGQLAIDPTTDNSSELFFWLYQSSITKHDKLIIWLNGGPGCSSMDGALMEIGPFRIDNETNLVYNDGTWLEDADLLFIDQPKGTGLSKVNDEYELDLNHLTDDFLLFLNNWLSIFGYYEDKQIYIAGESYAGQYIPYIGNGILNNNQKLNSKDDDVLLNHKLDLRALLIGNGYIYPDIQALSYLPFALKKGFLTTDNVTAFNEVYKAQKSCEAAINSFSNTTVFEHYACKDEIIDTLLTVTRVPVSNGSYTCHNMYDYSLQSPYPYCGSEWPFDLPQVTEWLNDPEVLKHLHVNSSKSWGECDHQVSKNLVNFNTSPSYVLLPAILEQIPIVLFNGGNDIICNHLGVENITKSLNWNNLTGWSIGNYYKSMIVNDANIGQVKSERNLTLIEIYNSSHMVPYDNSYNSRVVLSYLLKNFNENESSVSFPSFKKSLEISNYNKAFLVVMTIGLAATWASVLYYKLHNKFKKIRLEEE